MPSQKPEPPRKGNRRILPKPRCSLHGSIRRRHDSINLENSAALHQSEIAYDNSVVAHLSRGKDIKRAIRAANQEHPEEALEPGPEHWADLAARYEYILEHKAILKTLGMKE
jgi:hypothetical protein